MKIETRKWAQALMVCAALTTGVLSTSCSSDDEESPSGITAPEVTYKGNVAYSNGILFNNGTELGNGTQNFHFTGDVTLAKGPTC